MANTINREDTTDAPRPRRRNIRTSSLENRIEYLISYHFQGSDWEKVVEQNSYSLKATIQRIATAAYNAGRRDEKERRDG